jgi:ribosomal-protein-alanine N-acetyltransferase
MTLKLLTEEHTARVEELERLCFSEPWSEQSLLLLTRDKNFGVVASEDGEVVAYGGMTCCLDEGCVTNIAVHPEHRRRGLGRSVLVEMLDEAKKRGIRSVFLEVRVSNEAAKALYLSEGFSEIGRRKNFYRAPVEDALAMAYYFDED